MKDANADLIKSVKQYVAGKVMDPAVIHSYQLQLQVAILQQLMEINASGKKLAPLANALHKD